MSAPRPTTAVPPPVTPDPLSALQDYAARLRAVFDAAVDAVFTIDERGVIQSLNGSAERMFGYSAAELIGRNVSVLMPRPHAAEHDGHLARYLRTGEKRIIGVGREVVARRKDGSTFPIELAVGEGDPGSTHRFTGFVRDISERKELEAKFLRAQRLESVGTLVSGIAHDLNNVLTPILMAVKLLKKDRPGVNRRDLLDTAEASVERGAAMIRQLLTFAGGPDGERAPVLLKPVVKEVRAMLAHSFPKSITVLTHLPDADGPITGDATQLTQVLLNLCVNARDAMPDGGTLTIALERRHLNGNAAALNPGAKPGWYAVLTVADTGAGIPPEVQQKMFDPFFTTKSPGRGSGLGLSTVIGIVRSHGGFVNVYSEVGRGTKMMVYLPAGADAGAVPAPAPAAPAHPPGGGELLLLIDDEQAILTLTRATLEASGYRVLTACGGAEGLATARANLAAVRLVVVDMMMPGTDGPAVMAELRREAPALPVIAASGLKPVGSAAEAVAAHAAAFLLKPFSDDELLRTVARLLRPPEPPAAG